MYQNILVPLDGSSASEHAIPWALSVARQDEAAVRLVRVHLSPNPVMVGNELISDFSLDGAIRDQELAYLSEKVRQVKAVCKCDVTGELLDGPVTGALIDYIKARPDRSGGDDDPRTWSFGAFGLAASWTSSSSHDDSHAADSAPGNLA